MLKYNYMYLTAYELRGCFQTAFVNSSISRLSYVKKKTKKFNYNRFLRNPVCKSSHNFATIQFHVSDRMRAQIAKMLHRKCINGVYPSSNVTRFNVPVDKIPWNIEFPEYEPVEYTSTVIHGKSWADPEITNENFSPRWNSMDEKVNRQSFTGEYSVDELGRPLNPIGRTGIKGRGLLGRWGPNHAADPIVTRWKRNNTGALEIDRATEKPVLQFVAVQRRDSGEWAIPGGMVDAGENISSTLKREFMEETMNALEKSNDELRDLEASIEKFFSNGDDIHKGYVDDPRNTDNAWMETCATNFHDENGNTVGNMTLEAGDDAANVRWIDVNNKLRLYANHAKFIERVAHVRNAHW